MSDHKKTHRLTLLVNDHTEEVSDKELATIKHQMGRRFATSYAVEPLQAPKPDHVPPTGTVTTAEPKTATGKKAASAATPDADTPAA